MQQTDYEKVHQNKESLTNPVAFGQDLWYSVAEKSAEGDCTLKIEDNPCFRILHHDSDKDRRGRPDARLQKTDIHIIHQKQGNELLRSIFSSMYEVLNKGDPVKNE